MTIPKQFNLFGQTITVEWNEKLLHENDYSGMAVYRENKIQLMPNTASHPRLQSQIEASFCHELAHWFLYYASMHLREESFLHQKEGVVDYLGHLLHQYMTSKEGEL